MMRRVRVPPIVALLRGAREEVRLSVATRFGHRPAVQLRIARRSLAAVDRWYLKEDDPVADLHRAESKQWSQNGEDGLLAELVRRVGQEEREERTFVEIGAADGSENCTRALAEIGWHGVWVEGVGGFYHWYGHIKNIWP